MKSVSDTYKAEMMLLLRNQSLINIYFANIDPAAAGDGEWESNGSLDYSEVSTLNYNYEYQESVATLELNRWALNGQSIILPDSGSINDGFISDKLSDEDGEFVSEGVMTREFSEPHSFIGITLIFDTREKEYPRQVSIAFLANGDVVDETIISPTSPKCTVETSAEEVDEVIITFNELLPYRRPRVERVLWGIEKEYTNDDVVTSREFTDVDPLSRRLPDEQFTFTILDYQHEYDPDNPEGVYKTIDINSPIKVSYGYTLSDGSVEWLKPDNYLLNAKPVTKNNQATFSATGLIGSLTDIFYKSELGSKNFYDMAIEVLEDANLTPTEQGTDPWDVDESLKQMFTTAVLPIDTHMNCLQLIAHACCCRLFTDDDNIIHIKPFEIGSRETDFTLDFNSISEKSQAVSKIEQLRNVTVAKTIYTPDAEATEIYEETTTKTQIHVEFNGLANNIQITVTGGTLLSSAVYGRAADLVLSSGTKTIRITGNRITESAVVVSYPVASSGEIDTEENPLITSDEMSDALADHVKTYLQLRNTYDANYRGNPELEVGDIIGLQTLYTDEMDALILVDEITFDGSLKGKLKVKGLI